MPGKHSNTSSESEKQSSYVLKVLVLGDTGVGRRTLIQRFIGYDFFQEGYYRLTGSSFGVCQLEFGDDVIALQLWMLGCEPWFQSLRESHYRGSLGAIFTFSVTSRASFERIPGLAKEIVRTQGFLPAVLVGTKIDLREDRVISSEEGEKLALELGAVYIETQTTDDQKILRMFQFLVEEIIKPIGPPRNLVRIPLAAAPSQQAQSQIEKLLPVRAEDPVEESRVLLASLSRKGLSQQEFDERMDIMLEKLDVRDDLLCDYLRSLSAAGHREAVLHRLQSLQEEKTLQLEQPSPPEEETQVGIRELTDRTETKLEELDDSEISRLSRDEFDELVIQALKRLGLEEDQMMREYLISLSAAGHRDIVLHKLRTL